MESLKFQWLFHATYNIYKLDNVCTNYKYIYRTIPSKINKRYIYLIECSNARFKTRFRLDHCRENSFSILGYKGFRSR